MTNAKHTPGPFSYRIAVNGDCGITAPGCSVVMETFADIRRPSERARAESEANARRLTALWNACEGIPTEALESGVIRELVGALSHFERHYHAGISRELTEAAYAARTALAKAKGELT